MNVMFISPELIHPLGGKGNNLKSFKKENKKLKLVPQPQQGRTQSAAGWSCFGEGGAAFYPMAAIYLAAHLYFFPGWRRNGSPNLKTRGSLWVSFMMGKACRARHRDRWWKPSTALKSHTLGMHVDGVTISSCAQRFCIQQFSTQSRQSFSIKAISKLAPAWLYSISCALFSHFAKSDAKYTFIS